MKLSVEALKELICEDYDPNVFKVIKTEIVGNLRWNNVKEIILQLHEDGKFYKFTYQEGTGDCGAEPFEGFRKDEMIQLQQVQPRQVMKLEFVDVHEDIEGEYSDVVDEDV